MRKFFSFSWLTWRPRLPKEWAFNISIQFGGPGAGRDRCLLPGCGVQRKVHGRAHRFVEKAP